MIQLDGKNNRFESLSFPKKTCTKIFASTRYILLYLFVSVRAFGFVPVFFLVREEGDIKLKITLPSKL